MGCGEEGTEMIYFPGNCLAPLAVESLLGWELDHTGLEIPAGINPQAGGVELLSPPQ